MRAHTLESQDHQEQQEQEQQPEVPLNRRERRAAARRSRLFSGTSGSCICSVSTCARIGASCGGRGRAGDG